MYHRATLVILFVLFLLALHSTWSVYRKKIESEEMKLISLKQVEILRNREDELKSKIDKLATVYGVEEEIRSKFTVAKEGENMVVVIPDKETEVSTTSQKKSFWSIIKDLFNN